MQRVGGNIKRFGQQKFLLQNSYRKYSTVDSSITTLKELLQSSIDKQSFVSATLHSPLQSTNSVDSPRKIILRPVIVKNELKYQITTLRNRQSFDENVTPNDLIQRLFSMMNSFEQSAFHLKDCDLHVTVKDGRLKYSKRRATKSDLSLDHNRKKKYILEEGKLAPFLVHLGVMNQSGQILAKKYDKFKQINKFLELIEDIIPSLQTDKKLRIIDFGCGKAYLTFALHHLLVNVLNREVEIIGLDLKQDVVENCNKIASDLDCKGLSFEIGDIEKYDMKSDIDMVVTLHACNTATDKALAKAVLWNVDVILSVPCCHHELYTQIASKPLRPMLKHGILKERLSSLATDAIRGQILEILGYQTQIMEFVDMDHTPKNIVIRACKRTAPYDQTRTIREYLEFKSFLGADPYLETALGEKLQSLLVSKNDEE